MPPSPHVLAAALPRQPEGLRIRIFADGASLSGLPEIASHPLVQGLTTNPTLARRDGVVDYLGFARRVVALFAPRPVALEVLDDDLAEMGRQAHVLHRLGANVVVKVPITNSHGTPSDDLIRELSRDGVRVNVTAMTTVEQVRRAQAALEGGPGGFVSLLAGRIADSGRDPVPVMTAAAAMLRATPSVQLLWASSRELWNLFQAEDCGCGAITLGTDLLGKLSGVGRDLEAVSLATVKMFLDDARAAGYRL
jgi:transaldolase